MIADVRSEAQRAHGRNPNRSKPIARAGKNESAESGTDEVYVRPFPDVGEGRWQISNGGGIDPIWGPGGRELFFRTFEGHLMRVAIETEPKFVVANPEIVLGPGSYVVSSFNRSFDISPDGQRFLMMKDVRSTGDDPYAGLAQMIVVQNWFQELNAQVPVD